MSFAISISWWFFVEKRQIYRCNEGVVLLVENKLDDKKMVDQNLLDFCHELVIVNFLYEQKLLSKDEMQAVKQTIRKSYKFKKNVI